MADHALTLCSYRQPRFAAVVGIIVADDQMQASKSPHGFIDLTNCQFVVRLNIRPSVASIRLTGKVEQHNQAVAGQIVLIDIPQKLRQVKSRVLSVWNTWTHSPASVLGTGRAEKRCSFRAEKAAESTDQASALPREEVSMPKTTPALLDINFRALVRACASDPDIVALFNFQHRLNVTCPIRPLVDPVFPLEMEDHEALNIAHFVAWVQINQLRIKGAAAQLAKLKLVYDSRRWRQK
jgi:hypothetical protein